MEFWNESAFQSKGQQNHIPFCKLPLRDEKWQHYPQAFFLLSKEQREHLRRQTWLPNRMLSAAHS